MRCVHWSGFLGLGLVSFAGCPGGEVDTSDSFQGSTGSSAPGTGATTGAASAPTSSGAATSSEGSDGTTAAPSSCPDGRVDEGESCDDGNTVDGDGCNTDCTASGELLFEYRSGEDGDDRIYALAVDAEGIVVGGGSGQQRRVARFSFELTPQWSQIYDAPSTGLVVGVASGPGGVAAVGSVFDADGHDLWVARLAGDGALEWEDIVSSGFGADYATQVHITGDSDLIVTGLVSVEGGQTALWTRRYTPDDAPAWTEVFPLEDQYNLFPIGPGMAVTDEAVVVGWSLPGADFAELLVAYPLAGGGPLFTQTLPGTAGNLTGVAPAPGGDLVLTGKFESQLVVRRTSGAGAVTWSSFDCSGRNGRDVAVDSQGDIVVIGDGPGSTGTNIRVCKFSPTGELRWGKDIDGGVGDDNGFTVAIGPMDRVFVGGSVQAQGDTDDWLAVYAP